MDKFDIKKFKGTTYGLTPTEASKSIIEKIKSEIKTLSSNLTFLDIGAGYGDVVNDWSKLTKMNCIGIEVLPLAYKKAIKKFPSLHIIEGDIKDNIHLLKQADVMYLNDICFPDELISFCFENCKDDVIFICLKATTPYKIVKKYGNDIKKVVNVDTTINKMKAKAWIIHKLNTKSKG